MKISLHRHKVTCQSDKSIFNSTASNRRACLAALSGSGLSFFSRTVCRSFSAEPKPANALNTTNGSEVLVESLRVNSAYPAVGFSEGHLQVLGQQVPISYWYPAVQSQGLTVPAYRQRTSFGKIVSKFLRVPVSPRIFNVDNLILASDFVLTDAQPMPRTLPVVILAHGYLGSRFDLVHLAERLAVQGFIVASPEFGDSRSGEISPPGFLGHEAGRMDILQAAVSAVTTNFATGPLGLVGHSAGSGTIFSLVGSYPRVSIAGLVPSSSRQLQGPTLVVASSGDSTARFQGGIASMLKRLPDDFSRIVPEENVKAKAIFSKYYSPFFYFRHFYRCCRDCSLLAERYFAHYRTLKGFSEPL
mmetsp:Transcript_12133/g.28767  ORF Transcript_12133/g.28767 Transcript_12133/m.28767 type:complete len:359 (+) Transcript_12133:42-1118(+)